MNLKLAALAAIIAVASRQGALAAPEVAADNLWTDNLAWKCVMLAAYAPEKSAARSELSRITAVAWAQKKPVRLTGDLVPGTDKLSDDFWFGANYGAAADFVITDLFARLPPGGTPDLLGKEAAQLYDEKGCALLGK